MTVMWEQKEITAGAVEFPATVTGCVGLDLDEAAQLYGLLYKILNTEK